MTGFDWSTVWIHARMLTSGIYDNKAHLKATEVMRRASIHRKLVWKPSVSNTYCLVDYATSASRMHDLFYDAENAMPSQSRAAISEALDQIAEVVGTTTCGNLGACV